jgi:hypothetical protein
LILAQANGIASGYLASSDWLTFNSKQDSLGYTPLNQSGGTMAGTLNMGGKRLTNLPAPVAATEAVTKLYADATLLHRDGSVPLTGPWAVGDDLTNVGNINLSTQKTLGLGTYDADAEAILMASLKEDDQGKTWFSSNSGEIKYWDGYTAKPVGVARTGVMRMNGQGGNDQTLAKPAMTGTEPNWISDNNTHTLQIPLASGSGVTAGLISNDEYTIFQNKVNIAGDTMTGTLNLPPNALIAGNNQLVLANNNVGIGTTNPEARLDYVGQIRGHTFTAPSNTRYIDFDNGNQQTTLQSGAGSSPIEINLAKVLDGGVYSIALQNTQGATYTFSGSQVTNWKFLPENAQTVAGKDSIYTFMRFGNTVYVTWMTGF